MAIVVLVVLVVVVVVVVVVVIMFVVVVVRLSGWLWCHCRWSVLIVLLVICCS
jgi:hypothetical protein